MDRMEFIKLLHSNRTEVFTLLAGVVAESIVTPLDEAKTMVRQIVAEGYTPLTQESNDRLIALAEECRFIDPLIKVKYILIERAEGLIEECRKPVLILAQPMEPSAMPRHHRLVVSTSGDVWNRANEELRKIAMTAPKGGCYDKTDFWIKWEDGEEYQGRADVKHIGEPNNDTDLADHVWGFIAFHLGKRRPAWMTEAKYAEVMRQKHIQESIPQFEKSFYLYDLGINTY